MNNTEKTTNIVANTINDQKAIIVEQRTFLYNTINLLSFIIIGLFAVSYYLQGDVFMTIAGTFFAAIIGLDFYHGKSYYELRFPKTEEAGDLYKVSDVYFVGNSLQEAQLFAALNNLDVQQVEQVHANKVHQFN